MTGNNCGFWTEKKIGKKHKKISQTSFLPVLFVCVCVWLTPFLTFLSFLGRKKKRKEKFVLEHVSNICNLLLPLLISFTFLQKTLILSVKRLWDRILQSKNCVRLQVNFRPELSYFIEKKLVCLLSTKKFNYYETAFLSGEYFVLKNICRGIELACSFYSFHIFFTIIAIVQIRENDWFAKQFIFKSMIN